MTGPKPLPEVFGIHHNWKVVYSFGIAYPVMTENILHFFAAPPPLNCEVPTCASTATLPSWIPSCTPSTWATTGSRTHSSATFAGTKRMTRSPSSYTLPGNHTIDQLWEKQVFSYIWPDEIFLRLKAQASPNYLGQNAIPYQFWS